HRHRPRGRGPRERRRVRGTRRRGRREAPGRRWVSLLRVHPDEDDGGGPRGAGEATVTPAWSVVARRIDEEATTGWDDTIAVERLQQAGATVHHGIARLAGPGRVVVETAEGETLELSTR